MPRERILLLLDRDGTLMEDVGYPSDPETVKLIPDAAESIRKLVEHGFVPAVVSNQSGVARGLITPAQAQSVHVRFVQDFEAASGSRIPCFYCYHGPEDGCSCRKPGIGLLEEAARALNMTDASMVMVGDRPSDVGAGLAMKAFSIWLSFGREYTSEEFPPHAIASDWNELKHILIHWESSHGG